MKRPVLLCGLGKDRAPRAALGLFALGLAGMWVSIGEAQVDAVVHTVVADENLAGIAKQYYGDARKEIVLVAENGLSTRGGTQISVGQRLLVPVTAYHRVGPKDTWGRIAAHYYGSRRRAATLIEANPAVRSSQPDEGAEIIVPYPVRHVVVGSRQTLASIAETYLGDEDKTRSLAVFNGLSARRRLRRGDVVLVPMSDLTLSEQGRKIVAKQIGHEPSSGRARAQQVETDRRIPELVRHVHDGRYAHAVALGNRLLGAGEPTANQRLAIEMQLVSAYVALDEAQLAARAMSTVLALKPDLQFEANETSPKIRAVYERVMHQNAKVKQKQTR